jgi:hypothetical protein
VSDGDDATRTRRPLRATLGVGATIAVGVAHYWANVTTNSVDWELRWDRESWRRKLTSFETVRFDDNKFDTNGALHPAGGAMYYLAARSNGYEASGSFLIATAGSTVWEYVAEYREKPSLNDLVLTSGAGWVIGESLFRLADVYGRKPRNARTWLARSLLCLPCAVNDLLDGPPGERPLPWHRLSFSLGMGGASTNGQAPFGEAVLGAAAEVITQPGYGTPTALNATVRPGAFSTLSLMAMNGGAHLRGLGFRTSTVFGGHYWQRAGGAGDGESWRGLLVGAGSAFEYSWLERPDRPADRIAIAHLLGPVLDASGAFGELRLRFTTASYLDFAMVTSQAYGQHGQAMEPLRTKSVLAGQGYYYAKGITSFVTLAAGLGPFDAGASSQVDAFRSIQGFDRYQENLVDDFHLTDWRLGTNAWVGWSPRPAVRGALTGGRLWRHGAMEGMADRVVDTRLSLHLTLGL